MSQYARYPAPPSTGPGSGTVTSVGLLAPAIFTVSGSPVTISGNLTLSLALEAANTVFSGPTSGPSAPPTFRALVSADIPALSYALDSFVIMQTPLGTSPTASSASDTLTWFAGPNANFLITGNSGTKSITLDQHVSDSTHNGYLSATDWNTFNNKLSSTQGNFITNPGAEINTAGWNLYNNSGNTAFAYVVNQDITYTAVASGNAGNGINIDYIFHATQPSSTPLVTVVNPTLITVAWYNGPTLANNPTATQLKAAWDAVPGAVALATTVITGTASHLQYENGSNLTANGGDTAPINGTGGVPAGVILTRNTATPLVGIASFDLGKDAANRQGQGVSTDFIVDNADLGSTLQISFVYQGSSGMVLGASSDVRVFIYDIINAVLIPVVATKNSLSGPVSVPHTFTGQFLSNSSSANYRLILHIATQNATAWDLLFDSVSVSSVLIASPQTSVPSIVLPDQPISGAVTDHMCVMWTDGATQWVPATISGAALPVFGDDQTQLGFATNIVGSTASIYVSGSMGGFSFGPFTGFEQYIDNTAGGISPLPSPFTDLYVIVGMAINSTTLNIQFTPNVDLISNASGVPIKGGLLTSSAVNDGTGDVVLSPGANNTFLVSNSAAADGLNYRTLVSADIPNNAANTTGTAAHVTTNANLTGDVTSVGNATTLTNAPVIAKVLTGFVSGAGVVSAADSILTAFNKVVGNIALKAPLASPVFTGDVNSSTGNVLISTIGKGLSVKTGANAKIGTAVLAAGTVTVANTSVTANSRIFVTSNTDGGTPGWLRVSAKTVGTSFVITSSSILDTSTVAWIIVESIP